MNNFKLHLFSYLWWHLNCNAFSLQLGFAAWEHRKHKADSVPVGLQPTHKYKDCMFLLLQATAGTFDIKKKKSMFSFQFLLESKSSIMLWGYSNHFVLLSKYNWYLFPTSELLISSVLQRDSKGIWLGLLEVTLVVQLWLERPLSLWIHSCFSLFLWKLAFRTGSFMCSCSDLKFWKILCCLLLGEFCICEIKFSTVLLVQVDIAPFCALAFTEPYCSSWWFFIISCNSDII